MNWQVKDIEKKQSEEKIYKRGGLRPLFYIHRFFIRTEFILSFVVAMGRLKCLAFLRLHDCNCHSLDYICLLEKKYIMCNYTNMYLCN